MPESRRAPPPRGPVAIRLHHPIATLAPSPRWMIGRWPATVILWSAEEWALLRLTDRPSDAQRGANGVWCALRVD